MKVRLVATIFMPEVEMGGWWEPTDNGEKCCLKYLIPLDSSFGNITAAALVERVCICMSF